MLLRSRVSRQFVPFFVAILLACSLHAERNIKMDAYVWGGVTGSLLGFGVGHALQGRYVEKGWWFTTGEVGGVVVLLLGLLFSSSPSVSLTSQASGLIMASGLIIWSGFKIWEIEDLWVEVTPVTATKSSMPSVGLSLVF